jgi:hypothetical protein
MTAFVLTVVPCMTKTGSSGSRVMSVSSSSRPSRTASAKFGGLDGILKDVMVASFPAPRRQRAKSVNVPPMSMPILNMARGSYLPNERGCNLVCVCTRVNSPRPIPERIGIHPV